MWALRDRYAPFPGFPFEWVQTEPRRGACCCVRGSIVNLPTVSSKMSDWASDSDRCSGNCPEVRATVFLWCARIVRTRRLRIVSFENN